MNYDTKLNIAGAATQYMGQVQSATVGYQDSKPSQPSRLECAADHLGKMQAGFADINLRIGRLADRLTGSVPEAVEKTGQINGGPSCTAHRFELMIEDFGATLRRMDSLVTRLEGL